MGKLVEKAAIAQPAANFGPVQLVFLLQQEQVLCLAGSGTRPCKICKCRSQACAWVDMGGSRQIQGPRSFPSDDCALWISTIVLMFVGTQAQSSGVLIDDREVEDV